MFARTCLRYLYPSYEMHDWIIIVRSNLTLSLLPSSSQYAYSHIQYVSTERFKRVRIFRVLKTMGLLDSIFNQTVSTSYEWEQVLNPSVLSEKFLLMIQFTKANKLVLWPGSSQSGNARVWKLQMVVGWNQIAHYLRSTKPRTQKIPPA